MMAEKRFTIFVSYSHQDKQYCQELKTALRPFRQLRIESITDEAIQPGHDWAGSIARFMDECDAAILLVSQHFLASDFITGVELPRALALRRSRNLPVWWVPLATSSIKLVAPHLVGLQAASDPGVPLATLNQVAREAKLVEIADNLVSSLTNVRSPSRSSANGKTTTSLTLSRPFEIRGELRPPRLVVLCANQREVELPFVLQAPPGFADLPRTEGNIASWQRVAHFSDELYSRLRDAQISLTHLVDALDSVARGTPDAIELAADHQAHASRVLATAGRTVVAGEQVLAGLDTAICGSQPFRCMGHMRDCYRALQAGVSNPVEEDGAIDGFRSTKTLAGVLCTWLLQILGFAHQFLDAAERVDSDLQAQPRKGLP